MAGAAAAYPSSARPEPAASTALQQKRDGLRAEGRTLLEALRETRALLGQDRAARPALEAQNRALRDQLGQLHVELARERGARRAAEEGLARLRGHAGRPGASPSPALASASAPRSASGQAAAAADARAREVFGPPARHVRPAVPSMPAEPPRRHAPTLPRERLFEALQCSDPSNRYLCLIRLMAVDYPAAWAATSGASPGRAAGGNAVLRERRRAFVARLPAHAADPYRLMLGVHRIRVFGVTFFSPAERALRVGDV